MASPNLSPRGVNEPFVHRCLFLVLIVAIAALAVQLIGVGMLVFGAVIVAVVLRSIADPLVTRMHLPPPLAVLIAVAAVLVVLGTVVGLFGWRIAGQIDELWRDLPAAWSKLQGELDKTPLGQYVNQEMSTIGREAGSVASRVPHLAGLFASGLANLLVTVIGGIFLAAHPAKYRDGAVLLFPQSRRDHARDTFNTCGHALKMWLMAQVFSMVLVGTLTAVGLALVGVRSAIALGLVAGLAQFIPILGPVVSAVPGLLLAASQDWQTFFLALAVYVVVSQLESNLITPMVQKRVTSVPTVVTLFAVIAFGALLGPLGVLFATPLTVVTFTLVMALYVGGTLGDTAAASKALGKKGHDKPAKNDLSDHAAAAR